jgi:hypothetical protein
MNYSSFTHFWGKDLKPVFSKKKAILEPLESPDP